MYDIAPLIKRITAYAEKAQIAEATASYKVFGDGDRLSRLKSGKTITVKTAKEAWQKLDQLEGAENATS